MKARVTRDGCRVVMRRQKLDLPAGGRDSDVVLTTPAAHVAHNM